MRDVVKKEVLKLLHAGIIYPMPHSEWVSPVQVVPKKGGMTVVKNEKNELIPQSNITGWWMCIDYCGGINPYTLTAKLGLARINGFGPPERRRAARLT